MSVLFALLVAAFVLRGLDVAIRAAKELLPPAERPPAVRITTMVSYRETREELVELPAPPRVLPMTAIAVFLAIFLAHAIPTASVGFAAARGLFPGGVVALLTAFPLTVFLPYAARDVHRGTTVWLVQLSVALLIAWPIGFGLWVAPLGDGRCIPSLVMTALTFVLGLLCVIDAALLIQWVRWRRA